MPKDYTVPVLPGEGENDYVRYMRTDVLLSLQRRSEDMVHRDELLFQTVHQTTELWLKLACAEVDEAAAEIGRGAVEPAIRLLDRASLAVELITQQLEMLRHLAPWDFQLVRTALGHGSGFESPGWREVRRCSKDIGNAFDRLLATRGIDLVQLYQGDLGAPVYRLAEALIEWDERIAVWRTRHYKVATRILGHGTRGTQGTPVDTLAKLIAHKFFPVLWQVRTHLTETGPMAEAS